MCFSKLAPQNHLVNLGERLTSMAPAEIIELNNVGESNEIIGIYKMIQNASFSVPNESPEEQSKFKLKESLLALEERQQVPLHALAADVFRYWSAIEGRDKQLWTIANVIFGAAPSQVSVERSFNTLRGVLNDTENRLREERLEEILLLKLNSN